MKRLLVIGTGRMGQIRMKSSRIVDHLRLCGIVDANPDAAAKFGDLYDIPHAQSAEEWIKYNGKPDGIWISTPSPSHSELIKFCVKNDIPAVAVEKPVAMDPTETENLYKECESAGIPLFCGFNRRVDPHFQFVAEKVASGAVGEIQSMHSVFRDHPVPPLEFLLEGGDLSHDCGVHDIDFARSIMRPHEITRVFALGHSFNEALRKANVLDVVNGLLEFENQVQYSMEVSRTSAYGYDQRFEVFGKSACVKANNVHTTSGSMECVDGIMKPCYLHSFPERFERAWALEMQRFLNVMNGTELPFVSALDACRATQVAEACRLSIVHKAVVDIEYDQESLARCKYTFGGEQRKSL